MRRLSKKLSNWAATVSLHRRCARANRPRSGFTGLTTVLRVFVLRRGSTTKSRPQIADQMGSDAIELSRLLALVNTAMADAGIAIWESKYYYDFWRPVTGIREADAGTGPTGEGDGNPATLGDPTFSPLGAPASNLNGPNFTPPFPSYPSGHAGFGGALFQILRRFFRKDDIQFTFVSDEYNGVTKGADGTVRPLKSRSFRFFIGSRRGKRPEPHLSRHTLGVRQKRRNFPRPECCGLRVCQRFYAAAVVTPAVTVSEKHVA